jgi:hypothetical protein
VAAGFVVSWFYAGAMLIASPALISMLLIRLLIRTIAQQIINS